MNLGPSLVDHPKTRRAARMLGVSMAAFIGHMHLLWEWMIDAAPEGDLSTFSPAAIADAAMFDGDPVLFVAVLVDCGPGDTPGFLTADRKLHDWERPLHGWGNFRVALAGRPRSRREAVPLWMRRAVLERDADVCQLCGHSVVDGKVHIDHIVPVVHGGRNALENLQVAHPRCNLSKGSKL